MLTMEQLAALTRGRSLGGLAVRGKEPPDVCPRCRRSMKGRSWHSYPGRLGLHGLADASFEGDLQAAHRRLQQKGLAHQDPVPKNGPGLSIDL